MILKLKWFFFTLLASFLALTPLVQGAQTSSSAGELDEIVVTATKTEKKAADAPGSVTVLTSEELKRENLQTVDQALQRLSGIHVKRTKGLADSTPNVYMRGFGGGEYTLVLLDGMPLNDAYTGGVEWGALPLENILRIEVIRGPASALYGGNAMGGVINIITKTPEKLELSVTGGYGTRNTRHYGFNAGNRFKDKFSLQLGYEEWDTDGYATTPVQKSISAGNGNCSGGYSMGNTTGTGNYWIVGNKGKNGALRQDFDAKAVFDYSATGKISLTAVMGRHEYFYDEPETYMGTYGSASAIVENGKKASFKPNDFISYTGIGRNDTDIFTLAFSDTFGPVKLNAQVGTNRSNDRYTLESGNNDDDYNNSPGSLKVTENEAWFAEIHGDVPLGQAHLLTVGGSYRWDTSDTNDYTVPFYRSYDHRGNSEFYSGGKDELWAIFAQDEWQVTEKLSLYYGARLDFWRVYSGASGVPGQETSYDSSSKNAFSPKVSAVFKPYKDTTLRASVGRAFRAPSLYELYRTWGGASGISYSNPDLKPETVWTYEAGLDQYLFDRMTRLSITFYRNEIDDLIYFTMVNNQDKKRINAGHARTNGLELEVAQKVTSWLDLWGNYTFTHAKITENPTDPETEGKKVAYIPEHTFNLGANARYKWLTASLSGRYYSKIHNNTLNTDVSEGVYGTYEPAFVADAKVILKPWKRVELALSVDNIFNKEYYEYYKSDRRTFFAELTLRY